MAIETYPLSKEDYEEPRCPLNMKPRIYTIPIGRVIEKLDQYLSRNDYPSAERHLLYWIADAEACGDRQGKLTVLNEQIGLYRKQSKKEECFKAIDEALSLSDDLGLAGTVFHGTTLVNAATGYKAFGQPNKAISLYEEAKMIYERNLKPDDPRLGGLYNNMALALVELGFYREAEKLYFAAIDVMGKQEFGSLEVAITKLNLADLVAMEIGSETGDTKIKKYLEQAEGLLNDESVPRNGYYAFVCEKCAPVFGYYGYFLTEQELNRRAKAIYERT